ncbi:hypothetical protein JCM19297_3239 [Nonlabens ulvanivorans]|nr:hypothetical protein [Nonlabens ulvanivorans]GAK88726.1 hypothetical protein JCM19297_3239 [Nonlabens ulvanivorans]
MKTAFLKLLFVAIPFFFISCDGDDDATLLTPDLIQGELDVENESFIMTNLYKSKEDFFDSTRLTYNFATSSSRLYDNNVVKGNGAFITVQFFYLDQLVVGVYPEGGNVNQLPFCSVVIDTDVENEENTLLQFYSNAQTTVEDLQNGQQKISFQGTVDPSGDMVEFAFTGDFSL